MNFNALRSLAKSVKYQNLYTRAKELNNIRLFENDTDFSYIQDMFIYYIEVYNSLYTDLYSKEPNISQEVIDDWIRTEAYLFWKKHSKPNKEGKTTIPGPDSVVFKRK